MYYWLWMLFNQNSSALISLPAEIKTILTVSIAICFGMSLARRAWRILRVAVVVGIGYIACAALGII